jgi:hypothetical protein
MGASALARPKRPFRQHLGTFGGHFFGAAATGRGGAMGLAIGGGATLAIGGGAAGLAMGGGAAGLAIAGGGAGRTVGAAALGGGGAGRGGGAAACGGGSAARSCLICGFGAVGGVAGLADTAGPGWIAPVGEAGESLFSCDPGDVGGI